jgi:hypothetical protein
MYLKKDNKILITGEAKAETNVISYWNQKGAHKTAPLLIILGMIF